MARIEQATLGGGCFWCLEAVYQQLDGVSEVVSGYAGGHVAFPDYRSVCNGTTGHAEVVQLSYDADVITFRDLLDVFFTIHDPTTLNRQGADVGTQYRSAIYTHSEEQAQIARDVIAEISDAGVWKNPIVTEVEPLERFWPGEDYHQNYWLNNPNQGYCRVVIAPKVAKFRKQHLQRLAAAS
ncbi:MAG: peptide-methionine (S)-S-oxide reductase MsrA [Anaerolineaceae bacterium]|nr:peptide-methionine (S)-S-oxide reductase MsrA [Anaerolineaceae bacterium]MCY3906115.1 peptide-methionine (S)-S-oxide reductase MsrA [Anaerolineaceae bacterium]